MPVCRSSPSSSAAQSTSPLCDGSGTRAAAAASEAQRGAQRERAAAPSECSLTRTHSAGDGD
eukprot:CAMPEP_0180083970 /NCGR_PEP_ID=MMETSP0985-20121206/19609_1 /TAXON_ID=483367 /ORGANISM="non described non described, Strain CCMP 2436" /LENGTH=61 /DNA_ID=CAMNT_0022017595 /DNA_START=463 /DNA_END=645 /DNA_ORIENTATION=+